jgi:hypothetical protein
MRTASADTVDADEEVSLCVNQELILESLSYPKGTLFLEQTDLVIPESEDNDQNSIQSESKVNQLSQVLEGTAGSLSQGMRPSLSSGNLQQLGSTFKFSEEVRPLVLKVSYHFFCFEEHLSPYYMCTHTAIDYFHEYHRSTLLHSRLSIHKIDFYLISSFSNQIAHAA